MRKPKQKHTPLRESWRPATANTERIESQKRLAKRSIATLILVSVFILFGYLLFSPFYHPNLRLFYLTAGSYDAVEIRPIPFFRDEAVRFLATDGDFQKAHASREFAIMESPDSVRKQIARIGEAIQEPSDVVFLQITAHPLLLDDRPALTCANFNRESPKTGVISIEEVFDALARVQSNLTLVCLDLGPSDASITADSARDAFIAATTELMGRRSNTNLWLVLSNSVGEVSYSSQTLRSSVFSSAVAKGLSGEADLDGDSTINLEEFSRFVIGYTDAHVQKDSGGASNQTPLLIGTSSSTKVSKDRVLITSSRRSKSGANWFSSAYAATFGTNKEDDADAKKVEQEKAEAEKSWLTEYLDRSLGRVRDRVTDELEDKIAVLPTSISKKVRKSIGLEEDEGLGSSYSSLSGASNPTSNSEKKSSEVREEEAITQNSSDPTNRLLFTPPDISPLGNPDISNLQLVRLAWEFIHYLEQSSPRGMQPVDLASPAWNELVAFIHGTEDRLRTDASLDVKSTRLQLIAEIIGCYQIATQRRANVGKWATRLTQQTADMAVSPSTVPSLGLLSNLEMYGGPSRPVSVAEQQKQLIDSLTSDTAELLDTWTAQLPSEMSSQFIEFFWATRLSNRKSIPWTIKRKAITLWLRHLEVSSDPLCSNSKTRDRLDAAQRDLLEATRLAIDQIGASWVTRCEQAISKAESSLAQADEQRGVIRAAIQLRNRVIADVPALLSWRKIATRQLGRTDIDESLTLVLRNLDQLCQSLVDRENSDLSGLTRIMERLETARARTTQAWKDVANQILSPESKPLASTPWLVESLLTSSVVRDELRRKLLELPQELNLETPILTTEFREIANPTSLPPGNREEDLQTRLEFLAANLAGLQPEPDKGNASSDVSLAIERHYSQLPTLVQERLEMQSASSARKDLRLRDLRQADQIIRFAPTSYVRKFDNKPLQAELWTAEFTHAIQFQQQLLDRSTLDATAEEAAYLRNFFTRMQVVMDGFQESPSVVPKKIKRLEISGTRTLALLAEPQASGEIQFKNLGATISKVWVLVDYDPTLIEFKGPSGLQIQSLDVLPTSLDTVRKQIEQKIIQMASASHSQTTDVAQVNSAEQQLQSIASSQLYPIDPTSSMVAPTMGLTSGQTLSVPFQIKRIGQGPAETKLVWKLVGDREYIRHDITIQLPGSEGLRLVADGPTGSWSPTDEGFDLLPWPNIPSAFRFGLRNESGKSRTLSAELYSVKDWSEVSLPAGFLTTTATQDLLDRLGPLTLLANAPAVTVDSTAEITWIPFNSIASQDLSAEADQKSGLSKLIPTDSGLALVLTDKDTGQQLWRRIGTRVRHPRSYVTPKISFDSKSERLEIRLSSTASETRETKGIAVTGRIRETLPRGTEMNLEGTILPNETTVLYCQVPTAFSRELTVELDIDGFPRAYVFKVPCWRTNYDIPVQSDAQRIEIVETSPNPILGPSEKTHNVTLKIDAAPQAFHSTRDRVEIGWDIDRDREFSGETPLTFHADRQVESSLSEINNGRINVLASVSDISLTMPVPTARNQRVNLIARLTTANEQVWSAPVEFVLDADPPTITGVEIAPSTNIVIGTELQLRIGVDDAKLSGISSVEVIVDSMGIGTFAESTGPIRQSSRNSDGSWSLAIPTKELPPGRSTILVRAKDFAKNNSEVSKTFVSLMSEQDWKEKLDQATKDIAGSFSYNGNLLPNADVQLQNEKGDTVLQTKTNLNGLFRFAAVPSGKYKLLAKGVLKNRPRLAELSVEVNANPEDAAPLRVQLNAK